MKKNFKEYLPQPPSLFFSTAIALAREVGEGRGEMRIRTDMVTITDTDTEVAYTTCGLLQEVTRANDTTIMEVFGVDSMASIHITHYSIDLTAKALPGDSLRITSQYVLTGKQRLQVNVHITRTVRHITSVIATGNFIFINADQAAKNTTYNADTVLA